MPFKSQRQRRYFHWAAGQGKISRKTVSKWEAHTPKGKKLPEKVGAMDKYSSDENIALAEEMGKILAKTAATSAATGAARRVVKGVAAGLGAGGIVAGTGVLGYEVGKSRTEKRMAQYPKILARIAGMASKGRGVHMVASPQYYVDKSGKVRRKIGVRVRQLD